jgi:hypothetical protein
MAISTTLLSLLAAMVLLGMDSSTYILSLSTFFMLLRIFVAVFIENGNVEQESNAASSWIPCAPMLVASPGICEFSQACQISGLE